jgi:exopolysaccharide biosynthesis protein
MKTSLIIFLFAFSQFYAQVKTEEKIIDDGISYKKIVNQTDTLSIDILKIDLSKNTYEIRSVKANNLLHEKSTTSKMTEVLKDSGYQVIAAINADFFEKDGEIINNMIANSEIVKATKFTDSPFNSFVNSQFAITKENKLLIENFVFSGYLIFPDGTVESIKRINSSADSNSISLYNKFEGDLTPTTPENWEVVEFLLKPIQLISDTIKCIVENRFDKSGNSIYSQDEIILSANNRFAFYLDRSIEVSDTLAVVLNFNPNIKNIFTLVGGWPRLVADGRNQILINKNIEGVVPNFSEKRHPRTGVGFSKDSTVVYFITVDGRQKTSRGMTLKEFAVLMIEQGVYQGLNLDGGGSTTMIVEGEIVNSPSDLTGERAVGNCLVVIKKK